MKLSALLPSLWLFRPVWGFLGTRLRVNLNWIFDPGYAHEHRQPFFLPRR